jgi:NAD(P)-dependent dehydrogenase (short-subunit alcohol dehydrogenase family)
MKGKVIACCRSPTAATSLINLASKHPDRIQILPLDMEDQSSIDALASIIAQTYHRVDALFNVAGILGDGKMTSGPERSLANIERDWMEKTLAVNVVGPTMLIKALSPLMRSNGRRSVKMNTRTSVKGDDQQMDPPEIVLPVGRPPTVVANLSARVGSISDNQLGGWYTYRLSKAALNQVTRTLGHELKRQGTWIVALHPGTTDTDLSKPFQGNVREGKLFPVEFTVCCSI